MITGLVVRISHDSGDFQICLSRSSKVDPLIPTVARITISAKLWGYIQMSRPSRNLIGQVSHWKIPPQFFPPIGKETKSEERRK
jgi:hypothetical protein